ncbi:DEAD/DEAH box helicase [Actinomyces sp. 594]|uniref:DEAD/DEAH box helicase n=1 Tax=Actinomyces sp. 594 TaxID=2057793 RepID=UPI001C582448|nr:DEAD/DEAH box helicase [Actinomyces sp. 594]
MLPTLPDEFAPATRAWFDTAFPAGPTPVQRRAWAAIGRGENALVIAPTGSGKTLAAFLSAIDRLSRSAAQVVQGDDPAPAGATPAGATPADAAPDGAVPAERRRTRQPRGRGVRVLYISPLKALGADVERNLRRPLAGITAAAEDLAEPVAPITVGMRTGDTTPAERRRLRTRPPDILITTPESLYLMLTSAVRETLRSVETVIVDEIHSFAGQKRGTHLALSLERLDDLLPRPAQRIGLSATVRPRAEIARFLGGIHPVSVIADDDVHATPDVTVAVPVADMARVPATWDRRERALRGTPHRGGTAGEGIGAGGRLTGSPAGSGTGGRSGRQAWRSDRALRQAMAVESIGATGAPVGGRLVGAPTAGQATTEGLDADAASVGKRDTGAGAPARMTASIWPHIEHALLEQILAYRTTLVFVNSRGACERLTAHLNEDYAAYLAERGAASALAVGDQATAPGSLAAEAPAVAEDAVTADVAAPQAPDVAADLPDSPTRGESGYLADAAVLMDSNLPAMGEPVRHHESWEMGASQHTQPLPAGAPVIAKAHHGSVSKEQRREVEEELKSGRLRCVVATASLELGIDMGAIDLVLQVAPPPSVAAGLQRVGRAEHRVGGRPRGIIYPIQRTQLVDAAVVAEGMRAGSIEHTALVPNALDVLAQQTVAAVAVEDRKADDWYATVTRAAPYATLPRSAFDAVLNLLAGGYVSAGLADLVPRIVWDRATGALTARPGAQRLAVAASGTIPDRGLFPVMLPEGDAAAGRRRVGELDEEMVNESSVGDVITLGTASWRIRQIEPDRVIVDPAPGRSARLPFWHGEGAGRPAATGAAKGAFLRQAAAVLGDGGLADPPEPALTQRLARAGLDASARANLVALLREQRAATGVVPSDTTLVLESCRDENGSWRLILHSPFGRRVHEPWAMAVKERARRRLGVDPQIVTADDGMVLQTPPTDRPPGAELFTFDAAQIEQLVRSRVDHTAVFAARFRECAARALLMPASHPGRRAPLWLQRMKAGQLLEASRQFPGFPVSVEAARECLQDVWDLPALRGLMERLAAGTATLVEAVTQVPSPFAGPLLFGYTGAFLYQEDLPHAERRARLLSLDPDVVAEFIGDGGIADLLDQEVMARVDSELQRLAPGRRVRADAEGLADLLRELGPLSVGELVARCRADDDAAVGEAPARQDSDGDGSADAATDAGMDGGMDAGVAVAAGSDGGVRAGLAELERARRAFPVRVGGRECWARAEDAAMLRSALGVAVPDWAQCQGDADASLAAGARADACAALGGPDAADISPSPITVPRTPLADLLLRYARTHAAVTVEATAKAFGLGPAVAIEVLQALVDEGALMRLGGGDQARWMAPGVFTRVRNRSLAKARAAVKPVPAAALQRLVLERAGITARAEEAGAVPVAAGSRAAPGTAVGSGEIGVGVAPGHGVEALAEAIAALEGVWLPAGLWEAVVFPTRVADYRPAMLDELIGSGEVVWVCRTPDGAGAGRRAEADAGAADGTGAGRWAEADAGAADGTGAGRWAEADAGAADSATPSAGAAPRPPATTIPPAAPRDLPAPGRGGAALGEIAFFPSDSPLAPMVGDPVGRDELAAQEQWGLVLAGRLTTESFAPVRALLQPRPTAAPPRRVRSRRARRYGGYRTGYYTGRARPAGAAGSPQSTQPTAPPSTPPIASTSSTPPAAPAPPESSPRRQSASNGGAPTFGSTTTSHDPALAAALATASWRRLSPPQATAEEQAVADVESLLDRYGVVGRDVALAAGVPGGIGPLLPVLRRMEDAGVVARGAFVEGLGPSQFADRETVDRLRALAVKDTDADDMRSEAADHLVASAAAASNEPTTGRESAPPPIARPEPPVVLDLKDPACLVGGVVPWPEPALPPELAARATDIAGAPDAGELPRPAARQGAHVVLIGGRPVLHAAERLRALTCYTTETAELEQALNAVVAAETRAALRDTARPGKRVVETLNGISALDRVVGDLLQTAGLVRDPRGMRLHIDPYRR